MMTLNNLLNECKTSDLLRVFFSNKEYIYLSVWVCNAGSRVNLICTDNYRDPDDNGYDCILSNDWDLNKLIVDLLMERLKTISNSWTQNCYYYNFIDFLKIYSLSEYNYRRLLKIERSL